MITALFFIGVGYGLRWGQIRFSDGIKVAKARVENKIDTALKGD